MNKSESSLILLYRKCFKNPQYIFSKTLDIKREGCENP